MKIFRPLWRDGAFLVPQQFQQQARWDAHVADTVSRMALAHPWGVLRAEFDASALTLSRLNATRLIVRFADGTLIDTELADTLPPVRDVSGVMLDSVEVVLALPLLSASGGNLDDGQESARPRRWRAEQVTVQELAGHERSELAVLRHALTLRLSTEENAAFLTCPVARLVRDAQGQWIVDPEFIPPLFALLDTLLEVSLPSRVIAIALEQGADREIWRGRLHDARLREGADFYLSVRSSLPPHQLQSRFPQLCKAGSHDDVAEVVNIALSGIAIKPLSHVPAAIPLRLENQYFALDLSTDAARAMLEAGNCTFYTPESLGDVKLELFAVLRS